MIMGWWSNEVECPPWLRIHSFYRTKPSDAKQLQKGKTRIGRRGGSAIMRARQHGRATTMMGRGKLSQVLFVSLHCFVNCSF